MTFNEYWRDEGHLRITSCADYDSAEAAARAAWDKVAARLDSLESAVRALNFHTKHMLPWTEGSCFTRNVATRLEELQRIVPPATE